MKTYIVVFSVALLTGCFGATPENSDLEGEFLPDFSLLLTDSSTININNISTGKPLALFYFSPYCPYCRAQVKEITEDIHRLKGIQFYFISNFPMPDLIAFSKEYGLEKYPNITTGIDTAGTGADYFEIRGVPYIAIYGKDKRLNKAFMGKMYSSQLKKVAEE